MTDNTNVRISLPLTFCEVSNPRTIDEHKAIICAENDEYPPKCYNGKKTNFAMVSKGVHWFDVVLNKNTKNCLSFF